MDSLSCEISTLWGLVGGGKVVGPHNLFIDELYSITVEVEAALNSRPLTPMDSAPDEVLTPGHFLVGRALKSLPATDYSTRKINTPETHRRLMGKVESGIYYTPSRLQQMSPPSTVALIKDMDLLVRTWPLARVIDVHPGDDGLVRVATVKSMKGIYRRAVHKLVTLLEEAPFPSPPEDVRDPALHKKKSPAPPPKS